MIRLAHERVGDLFELAAVASGRGEGELAVRYVRLARSVGMRYNVRLPATFRERYCRGCSAYAVEGRTVRTRLRGGRSVRTCLVCGRVARRRLAPPSEARGSPPRSAFDRFARESQPVAVEMEEEAGGEDGDDEGEDE